MENGDKTHFPIGLCPRQQCLINCCVCLAEMSLGIWLPTALHQVHCKTSDWLSIIPGLEEALSLPTQQNLWLFKGKIILLDLCTDLDRYTEQWYWGSLHPSVVPRALGRSARSNQQTETVSESGLKLSLRHKLHPSLPPTEKVGETHAGCWWGRLEIQGAQVRKGHLFFSCWRLKHFPCY